jgi:hypothetical protein
VLALAVSGTAALLWPTPNPQTAPQGSPSNPGKLNTPR